MKQTLLFIFRLSIKLSRCLVQKYRHFVIIKPVCNLFPFQDQRHTIMDFFMESFAVVVRITNLRSFSNQSQNPAM